MRLNLENGVKLEIKKSEIKQLNKAYQYVMSVDESIKVLGVNLILGIVPADKSVGVVYSSDQNTKFPVLYFIKTADDPNNMVEIHKENWIIENDIDEQVF